MIFLSASSAILCVFAVYLVLRFFYRKSQRTAEVRREFGKLRLNSE